MFTGIIEALGRIAALQPRSGDLRVHVATNTLDLHGVAIGDSIATNGVCLTVVELPGDGYWADVSRESLAFTTIEQWRVGDAVNLERALTPQSRLGGHIVSGHVDGVGEVVSIVPEGDSRRISIAAPQELAPYLAAKGSITVDGVSLTVNEVSDQPDGTCHFALNIIPHTAEVTTLGALGPGSKVNLEIDVLARYLKRMQSLRG